MNCKAFRKQIDTRFDRTGYEIAGELLEHTKSCKKCSAYLSELKLLQDALNKPRLEVLPGELDDLSFEKIVALEPIKTRERRPVRIAWPFKWFLAPAAVGAIAIIIIMLARPTGDKVNEYSRMTVDPYSSLEIDDAILSSDSLSMEVLSSMAGSDAVLDRASDELLNGFDIDDLLGIMTPGELKALYDKIDNLKG